LAAWFIELSNFGALRVSFDSAPFFNP